MYIKGRRLSPLLANMEVLIHCYAQEVRKRNIIFDVVLDEKCLLHFSSSLLINVRQK